MRPQFRASRICGFFLWRAAAFVALLGAAILPLAQNSGQTPDPLGFPNLLTIPTDLTVPEMTTGAPAPGRRVKQINTEYQGTDVYHTLYLPRDWKKGKLYPVIVEYAGNGQYHSEWGDVSTGVVEGSELGYGISGGKGFIWICLPFVNSQERRNQTMWWGDTEATIQYCKTTVRRICEEYGGDSSRIILAGFSRGAIACNYIGLHDDAIADIWLAFIPYSHYDGVRKWDWEGSDRPSALERLKRLKGRATFSCQERSVDDIRAYIDLTGVVAPFTFLALPFRNHNAGWVLRDIPARRDVRAWVEEVLRTRPGTHSIQGRVATANGKPLSGVCVESGGSHFTYTDRKGQFILAGLIDSHRTVTASQNGRVFTPPVATVEIRGTDVGGLTFAASR